MNSLYVKSWTLVSYEIFYLFCFYRNFHKQNRHFEHKLYKADNFQAPIFLVCILKASMFLIFQPIGKMFQILAFTNEILSDPWYTVFIGGMVRDRNNGRWSVKTDQKFKKKKKTARKFRLFSIFTTSFFLLEIKKVKKLQHFWKFRDICTICMNRKMYTNTLILLTLTQSNFAARFFLLQMNTFFGNPLHW